MAKGSVSRLLGSPSIGKTLMGLHFIAQGLRDGENCLIVGFYESPARLSAKGSNVGIELAPWIEGGQLNIMWQLPLVLLIDDLATRMLATISERGVTRLLIAGVEGLLKMVMHPERAPSFLIALVNELCLRGATTFFTEQLSFFKKPRCFGGCVGIDSV